MCTFSLFIHFVSASLSVVCFKWLEIRCLVGLDLRPVHSQCTSLEILGKDSQHSIPEPHGDTLYKTSASAWGIGILEPITMGDRLVVTTPDSHECIIVSKRTRLINLTRIKRKYFVIGR
jgi:hypothetical protein